MEGMQDMFLKRNLLETLTTSGIQQQLLSRNF